MKDKFLFIGKFVLFSSLLFLFWVFIGRYYLIFLAHAATPFIHTMGYDVTLVVNEQILFTYLGSEMGLTHSELANYNIIPFIALVLATPITVKKMGKNLLIGLPVIFCFHLLNLIAHFPLYYDGNIFANFIISFSSVTRMLIPFLLWFGLSYDYVLDSFRSMKKMYPCPICGKKTHGVLMHIRDVHQPLSEKQQKEVDLFKKRFPELKDR